MSERRRSLRNARFQTRPSCDPRDSVHPDGDTCPHWELRFRVALHAGYYLAIRIRQPELRERVIEHLAVGWTRWHAIQEQPGTLVEFFERYMEDVERDIDPNPANHEWEYHRVWTNHASVLGGELSLIQPRP